MLIVESIRKIRQAYHRDHKPIRQIAREFHLSKNTVKKIIRSDVTEQVYLRNEQPRPKLGPFEERLVQLLEEDSAKPVKHRRSALLLRIPDDCDRCSGVIATGIPTGLRPPFRSIATG